MGVLQKFSLRFLMIVGICCAGFLFYMIHWKHYAAHDFPPATALFPTAVFLSILLGMRRFLVRMESAKGKERILFLFILVMGFLLRLGWVLFVPMDLDYDYAKTWNAAGQIANGDWQSFGFGEFLYKFPHWAFSALFYSVVYKIGSGDILIAKSINVFFWILECYLIYDISKETTKNGALMAIFLAALNPADIFYSAILDPQNMAIPLFWGATLVYLKIFNGKARTWRLALAGALLGVGNLFRPVAIVFFLAIFFHALLFLKIGKDEDQERLVTGKKRRSLGKLGVVFEKKGRALALMLAMMLLLPFLMNQPFVRAGIFQKKSTDAGTWLLYLNAGMNHESDGRYNKEDAEIFEAVNYDLEKANEIAKKRLIERTSDKKKLASLLCRKFGIQWGFSTCYPSPWWLPVQQERENSKIWVAIRSMLPDAFMLSQSMYGAIVVIILINLLTNLWALNERIALPLLCWLGVIGLHLLIETQPRYGRMVIPGIMLLGSGFSRTFQNRRMGLQWRKAV